LALGHAWGVALDLVIDVVIVGAGTTFYQFTVSSFRVDSARKALAGLPSDGPFLPVVVLLSQKMRRKGFSARSARASLPAADNST
jgi:hypothetical protein